MMREKRPLTKAQQKYQEEAVKITRLLIRPPTSPPPRRETPFGKRAPTAVRPPASGPAPTTRLPKNGA